MRGGGWFVNGKAARRRKKRDEDGGELRSGWGLQKASPLSFYLKGRKEGAERQL